MKIYAIEACGDVTNEEPSIVTIWNNREKAFAAMLQYKTNCESSGANTEYCIRELDTDNELIYDYDTRW